MLKNDVFLRAVRREPTPYTPIWLMRQAGRYLPQYRMLRKKMANFMQLCRSPQWVVEASLQPIEQFSFDAAIVFSDILVIPDAMGLGVFFDEQGPHFAKTIQCSQDVLQLQDPIQHLSYLFEGVAQLKTALADRIPLIGFVGSPFTLACYMVEGESQTQYKRVLKMIYDRPQLFQALLAANTSAVMRCAHEQIVAGADAVMIFDSWGGMLSTPMWYQWSHASLTQIIHSVRTQHPLVPVIVFVKGGGLWLDGLVSTGCHAVSLDWMTDIRYARERIGHAVALQGNLDPRVLLSDSPDVVVKEAQYVLNQFGPHAGHVFNLGHGVDKESRVENVSALVEAVHAHRTTAHVPLKE